MKRPKWPALCFTLYFPFLDIGCVSKPLYAIVEKGEYTVNIFTLFFPSFRNRISLYLLSVFPLYNSGIRAWEIIIESLGGHNAELWRL